MQKDDKKVKNTEEKSGTASAGSSSSDLLCDHVFETYNDKVYPVLLACKYCGEIEKEHPAATIMQRIWDIMSGKT